MNLLAHEGCAAIAPELWLPDYARDASDDLVRKINRHGEMLLQGVAALDSRRPLVDLLETDPIWHDVLPIPDPRWSRPRPVA